jgi:hypothetical protein
MMRREVRAAAGWPGRKPTSAAATSRARPGQPEGWAGAAGGSHGRQDRLRHLHLRLPHAAGAWAGAAPGVAPAPEDAAVRPGERMQPDVAARPAAGPRCAAGVGGRRYPTTSPAACWDAAVGHLRAVSEEPPGDRHPEAGAVAEAEGCWDGAEHRGRRAGALPAGRHPAWMAARSARGLPQPARESVRSESAQPVPAGARWAPSRVPRRPRPPGRRAPARRARPPERPPPRAPRP